MLKLDFTVTILWLLSSITLNGSIINNNQIINQFAFFKATNQSSIKKHYLIA